MISFIYPAKFYHLVITDTKKMLLPTMMLVRFCRMKYFYGSFRFASYLLSLAISTLSTTSSAEATNLCNIQIAGVRVVASAPGNNDNLRAFNWSPGVAVAMLVTAKEGCLLSFDRENSRLDTFTDEKGGNLMAGVSRAGIGLGSSQTFERTNALLLEVNSRSTPTKGATELSMSGKLFVLAASQTKQYDSDEKSFIVGTEFGFENLKLVLSKIKDTADGCNLTLSADQDLTSLSHIEFFDENGIKVVSRKSGTSSSISPTGTEIRWSFSLNKKLERGKISVVRWTDLKTVEVPINVKTTIGI